MGMGAPGASVGKLTINGNYTQSASGTLRIEKWQAARRASMTCLR